MKTRLKALIAGIAALLPLAASGTGRAVTLDARPNPAVVNQSVTLRGEGALVSVRGASRSPRAVGLSECGIAFDFGDGASTTVLCGDPSAASCSVSATHSYARRGTYRVTAVGECGARTGRVFAGPTNAQVSLVVSPPAPTPGPTPAPAPAPQGTLSLSAEPGIVRAPRETGAVATVQYRVASPAPVNVTLVSPAGRFEAGGESLGTVEAPLVLTLAGTTATAAESVRFAPELLRAAFSRGARTVSFVRDFSGGGRLARATVTALIIAPAVEFDLERMELSFANNRPEITVQRGERGLAARARLRFTGSGLLQAHWEVDGRVLAPPVSRHLALGAAADLESPVLPTFDPGTHIVRLVVTTPAAPAPLPTIVYFVRPSDAAPRPVAIRLSGPGDGESLPYQPALFRWEGAAGAAVFLVQFFAPDKEAPVFSAWTRASEYRLPELLYRSVFVAGGRYRWKVSAFNAEENLTGESPAASFAFQQPRDR